MPRSELVQSVTRAVDVLEVIAGASDGLTPSEAAAELRLNRSTVQSLIRTLQARELLETAEERGRYRLGPAVGAMLELQSQRSLVARAADVLQSLQRRLPGFSVSFSRPVGGEMHSLAKIDARRPDLVLRPQTEVLHPYVKASGLTFLAFGEQNDVAALRRRFPFVAYARPFWTSRERLEAFLDDARRRGVVVPPPEPGCPTRAAAPVFDPAGRFLGAIGAFRRGPDDEAIDDRRREELVAAVTDAARGLTEALGKATRRAPDPRTAA